MLLLVKAEGGIETFADEFLSCLFTQGLPSIVIVVQVNKFKKCGIYKNIKEPSKFAIRTRFYSLCSGCNAEKVFLLSKKNRKTIIKLKYQYICI